MKSVIKYAMAATAMAALIGCGGGGDGDGDGKNPPQPSAELLYGVMLAGPVEGLDYRTETQQGTTDINGRFKYLKGEEVTFYIYGTEMGTTTAASVNTPFDLNSKGNLATYAVNIIRLINSLDVDANPVNGIQLPKINFNNKINFDQSPDDFSVDPSVVALLAAAGNRSLASASEALVQFENMLSTNTDVSGYSVSLIGKEYRETITDPSCGKTAQISTKFISETEIIMVSNDFIDGTCENRPTEEIRYTSVAQFKESQFKGSTFNCIPNCTFVELNRFQETIVGDELVQELVNHRFGSNIIQYMVTVPSSDQHTVRIIGTSLGQILPL
jgi:hypothetical protein